MLFELIHLFMCYRTVGRKIITSWWFKS